MILLLSIVIVILVYLIRHNQFKKYEHIPGPPGLPLIGNAFDSLRDHQKKCLEWAKKYGPVYKYKLFFWYIVVVTDPKALKHITVTNDSNYTKNSFFYKAVVDETGENLVSMSNVEKHKVLRKAFTEAFTYQSLRLYFPIFMEKSKYLVDVWKYYAKEAQQNNTENERVVEHDLTRLTLDIIGQASFATDFKCTQIHETNRDNQSKGERLHKLLRDAYDDLGKLDLAKVPIFRPLLPARKAQIAAKKEIMEELTSILTRKREIAKNRENDESGWQKDLLDIMVCLKDDNGELLSMEVLCNHCVIFILAGHDTSASTLMFILYFLAKHPLVQEKLVAEIQAANDTSMEALDALPYLNCVIKEALRLFPPAVVLLRKCEQNDILCGISIPAGTLIEINAYVMQNLETNWEKATEFIPERWANAEEKVQRGAYIPFSAGTRNCIGSRFALLEIKAILSVIVPRFSFSLPSGFEFPAKLVPMPTLRTVPGIKLIIKSRE